MIALMLVESVLPKTRTSKRSGQLQVFVCSCIDMEVPYSYAPSNKLNLDILVTYFYKSMVKACWFDFAVDQSDHMARTFPKPSFDV